jgi:hypothetical protein
MPEVKHQVSNSTPEISLAEVLFPNDAELGTGTFTTTLESGTLLSNRVISCTIVSSTVFQISVTVHPNGDGQVLLGKADGSVPLDAVNFLLPDELDVSLPHAMRIKFVRWRILSASLDGQSLDLRGEYQKIQH